MAHQAGQGSEADGLAAINMLINKRSQCLKVVDLAASTATLRFFLQLPTGQSIRVTKATFLPDVASATNGTHYATIALVKEDGAAGGVTVIGSVTTAVVSNAVGVPRALALVVAEQLVVTGTDEVLALKITKAGNGVVVGGMLEIEYDLV
jgi:hypothetical protein